MEEAVSPLFPHFHTLVAPPDKCYAQSHTRVERSWALWHAARHGALESM